MATCESCGNNNEATANFCAQCGARIAQVQLAPIGAATIQARADWDWRYFVALWICTFVQSALAMRDQVAGHPAAYAAGEIFGASAVAPVAGLLLAVAVKVIWGYMAFWRTAISTAVVVIAFQVIERLFPW